jgi:hypothetical protein
MSMKNKIITIALSLIFLLSTGVAKANSPGVRGDIPSVGTENRDLTFRMKTGFLDSLSNPLKVSFETSLRNQAGESFIVDYSEDSNTLDVARGRRKVTLKLPFVESDTRGELVICGGRLDCQDAYRVP